MLRKNVFTWTNTPFIRTCKYSESWEISQTCLSLSEAHPILWKFTWFFWN